MLQIPQQPPLTLYLENPGKCYEFDTEMQILQIRTVDVEFPHSRYSPQSSSDDSSYIWRYKLTQSILGKFDTSRAPAPIRIKLAPTTPAADGNVSPVNHATPKCANPSPTKISTRATNAIKWIQPHHLRTSTPWIHSYATRGSRKTSIQSMPNPRPGAPPLLLQKIPRSSNPHFEIITHIQ